MINRYNVYIYTYYKDIGFFLWRYLLLNNIFLMIKVMKVVVLIDFVVY